MLIGLVEDMAYIDFGLTMSKVKVTKVNFVKNVNMVSTHYLAMPIQYKLRSLFYLVNI